MLEIDVDFDDDEPAFKLRGRQEEWLNTIDADLPVHKRVLVVAPGGIGKCLGAGTPVMLFDGHVKPVEDIKVGDLLMGPDSAPRTVISTCSGVDELYKITPIKGAPFVTNGAHILSMKVSVGRQKGRFLTWGKQRFYHGEVLELSTEEYYAYEGKLKKCTMARRTGVSFPPTELNPDMPPYMLGLWLGDGGARNFSITKPDPEVKKSVEDYAAFLGHSIRIVRSGGNCPTYIIHCGSRRLCGRSRHPNRALNALKALGLLYNKHIPHAYKTASREDRLELLAGLMDSDGHLIKDSVGYDYISISERLCSDIAFVARSLGLAAYYGPCVKRCQNNHEGTYYRLSISGDCDMIPCRIPRKVSRKRNQVKDVLCTGIRVEKIGQGPYYGFQLAGNDANFLLGDFTITHNSTIFAALASRYHKRGLKTLVLTNRDMLARQTAGRIQKETGIDVEIEMGGDTASPFAPIVVGSVQTLMRMNRLTSFADDHFGLVVGDEAHFSLATGWQRVLNYFHYGKSSLQDEWSAPPDGTYECKAVVAGFTATPDIGEKKNLGEFYAHRSVNYSYLEAVNDGWLVPPIQKTIPVKVDLRKYKVQRGLGGTDFKASDLTEAMVPIIESLAEQIVVEAHDRKTMAFLPSVECAKMMNDALCRRGINSIYVSGECSDGDEKTEMFRRSGAGSALCNAQIYNFGVDFPDVNCVAWMRATLSKAFLIQGLYRGSRVLPGVIDGLNTPEERRAAIANSAKPNMLILDPLFVSDRIDIMDAYSLFTDKPEVRERMKNGDGLSAESAQKAERDFLKSLEREAKRTANRKARTFDPLAFAVSIGEESLSTWQPTSTADLRPPTKGQLEFLKRQHADTTHIKYFYQAQKLIGRLVMRMEAGLATPNQLSFLAQLGFNEQDASKLTIAQAGAVIDQMKRKKSA